MTIADSSTFLRRTLWLDAAVSGTTGIVMALGAGALEPWLAIPGALVRVAGVSLLPFAALLVALATRPTVPKSAIAAVIVANALWVVASIALLVSGQVAPTLLGYVFVVVQAVAVLGFAELQWVGLRRLGGPSIATS
jgi:CHASE2 domain-containing sensor protein